MQQDQPPPENQRLTSSARAPSAHALRESRQAQAQLDSLIAGCFVIQKLYGRDPGSVEAVNQIFHSTLGGQPADKVVRAFGTWLELSQEFPTPADILGLIKRNGRPPLSEAQFVAISRKDGADRTPEEWQYLRDFQAERDGGWEDAPDPGKQQATLAENVRLRKELGASKDECRRLSDLLAAARSTPASSPLTGQEKARRTVEGMRAAGAAEEDVREFAASQGIEP